MTSGEHYGAVINRDFDFVTYLDELRRHRLNNTRIRVGPYHEVAGNFNITGNTLAPKPDRLITPWPRSAKPGAADGLNKFDLDKWNPDFFTRLKNFIREADKREIVVEVTLFCPYYKESMWDVSPLDARNNVNGAGDTPRSEVLTMLHPGPVKIQEARVRKIVNELSRFDNLYYEICNEPYAGGVTLDWQQHIAGIIHYEEGRTGRRHLISQNVANGSKRVERTFDTVSILNFHYSRPADSIRMNYDLARALGNNETGFDGTADAACRVQGWEFLMAGGALYNNLDYPFTVGHERGDFRYPLTTPGGGSPALRAQLGILSGFFSGMPFVQMAPGGDFIRSSVPDGATLKAMSQPGAVDAAYVHHGRPVADAKPRYQVDGHEQKLSLELDLPPGRYGVAWMNPRTGKTETQEAIRHAGSLLKLTSPRYTEDIAFRLTNIDRRLRP